MLHSSINKSKRSTTYKMDLQVSISTTWLKTPRTIKTTSFPSPFKQPFQLPKLKHLTIDQLTLISKTSKSKSKKQLQPSEKDQTHHWEEVLNQPQKVHSVEPQHPKLHSQELQPPINLPNKKLSKETTALSPLKRKSLTLHSSTNKSKRSMILKTDHHSWTSIMWSKILKTIKTTLFQSPFKQPFPQRKQKLSLSIKRKLISRINKLKLKELEHKWWDKEPKEDLNSKSQISEKCSRERSVEKYRCQHEAIEIVNSTLILISRILSIPLNLVAHYIVQSDWFKYKTMHS